MNRSGTCDPCALNAITPATDSYSAGQDDRHETTEEDRNQAGVCEHRYTVPEVDRIPQVHDVTSEFEVVGDSP